MFLSSIQIPRQCRNKSIPLIIGNYERRDVHQALR
jgi:hypothetical protein